MTEAVLHVVGARPNFMKAAPVIAALDARGVSQMVVHTGQHYDERMSDIFFRQLGLPEPDRNLGVGSGSHAAQTGALLGALEDTFLELRPRLVVAYGDVNSTLAAALVCAKLVMPVAHVEAGLRSFDASMPEEVNRVVTDRLSSLLFATSPEALTILGSEGVHRDRVHFVGNPMIDTLLRNLHRFDVAAARQSVGVGERYAVATLHRPANVDDPVAAADLVAGLRGVAAHAPVVLPLHPRGRSVLDKLGLGDDDGIIVVDPLGYVEFISLVRGAALVVTDSGGIQEETTVLDVPCLTVRPNTERPITLTHGTNQLATAERLPDMADAVMSGTWSPPRARPPLWDGHAGERIADVLDGFASPPKDGP